MGFETSTLESKKEVPLKWPTEFTTEEIQTLEEATGIYNTMHRLDQLGMADTKETLAMDSDPILINAKKICEDKGYRLESLIEQVQAEAEEKYQAAA